MRVFVFALFLLPLLALNALVVYQVIEHTQRLTVAKAEKGKYDHPNLARYDLSGKFGGIPAENEGSCTTRLSFNTRE